MITKILWKGALIGTLALPLAALAQSDTATGSDQGSVNQPSTGGMDQQKPSDQTGIQGDTGKSQGTQGQTMGDTSTTKEITGTISKVGSKEVWLKSDDGQKMTLHIDSSTKVYKPTGATEKITQLKEGQQVRASYNTKNDQMHATRIDVMEAGSKSMDNMGKTKPDTGATPTTPQQ